MQILSGAPPLMAPGPIKLAGIRLSSCLVTVNRQFANPPNLPSLLETLLNSLGIDRGRLDSDTLRLLNPRSNIQRAFTSVKFNQETTCLPIAIQVIETRGILLRVV